MYFLQFNSNKFLIGSFILLLAIAETKEPLLYSGVASRMFILLLVYCYCGKISTEKPSGFQENNLKDAQSARSFGR